MAEIAVLSASTSERMKSMLSRWILSKDPDLLVVKRSLRAAVVVSSVFAITHELFSNPQVGLFGAFGSFSLLLLVEFTGPVRTRVVSYLGLYLIGSGLIVLGTAVSSYKVAAVVIMGAVGFVVLFAGIVSPQAATASTAALLMFVLPVSVAQPASAIGPRMVGWTIAAVFCIPGCLLVWPPPWHDNLRKRLAAAVRAVADLADARAQGSDDSAAATAVSSELARLREQFSGTPYPPTGAASNGVALSKLVGRVEWVASNTAMIGDEHWSTDRAPALAVTESVADTLHETAGLICDGLAHPVDDPERIKAVQYSTQRLDRLVGAEIEADESSFERTRDAREATATANVGAGRKSGRRARSRLPCPRAGSRDRDGRRCGARSGRCRGGGRPSYGYDCGLTHRGTPSPISSLPSIGMVPQCIARCDRSRTRGFGD